MPDYKTMYFQLAAKVSDAVDILIEAQKQGEESYISDNKIHIFREVYKKPKQKTVPRRKNR